MCVGFEISLTLVTSTGIAKKQFHVMDINDRKEQKKQSHRENLFHFGKVKKKSFILSFMIIILGRN